ncbi:hypothetical protein TH8_06195 [Thalassospira profundimaris]|nr:hypothetical protein TH8_06195 [Thalassospira profundimaris]
MHCHSRLLYILGRKFGRKGACQTRAVKQKTHHNMPVPNNSGRFAVMCRLPFRRGVKISAV